MTIDTISQTVLFPNLFDKPLQARFDQPHTSSDRRTRQLLDEVAAINLELLRRREPID